MDEINDIGNVIANIIDNKGEDKRNFFGILRAQRGATDLYNISGDSLNLLNEAYKSNKIGADEYKEGLRNIIEATGNDLGLNVSLVYLDTSTMPKDSERSTGSSYIVDKENRKVLIPIDVNKIEDIKKVLGTLTEEVAHGKDALEGRQDKKVAEDKSNDEEGLETLGRPANEYVKKKFGEDNNSEIKLTTDGIDLSNADVGEKVGDVENENYEIATFSSAGIGSAGVGLIGGLSLLSENNEYIKKVTIEVKEKLSKFGNNVKILYAVAKTLIEEKLKEKGIEADVKITEDKNGNVSYTVYPLDKGNKRNSKLSNSSGTNISKASSSNNSDKKNENKEENINKDDKGSEDNKDNKDNKEPNNEEKKPAPKNEDDSDIGLKIGAGTGAAYEIKSGIKNSNNKNTTSTAQENSNKNANPSNQRGQVSQSNKNNANKPKTEESNPNNQQVSKKGISNNQQGAPVSKTSDVNKLEVSKGLSGTTQKNDSANKKPILQESKDDIIEKRGNYTIYDDYAKGPKGRIYDKVAVSKNGEIVYEKHGKNYIIEKNGTKTFVEYDKNTGEIKKSYERVNRYSKEFLNTLYSKYDKLENGNYRNKETGEIIEAPINIGHGYGFEHRRYVKAAQQVGMPDQKTFREYMNTQTNHFKLESESGNKSHKDEKIGVDGTEDIEKDMKKFLEDKNNKNKK